MRQVRCEWFGVWRRSSIWWAFQEPVFAPPIIQQYLLGRLYTRRKVDTRCSQRGRGARRRAEVSTSTLRSFGCEPSMRGADVAHRSRRDHAKSGRLKGLCKCKGSESESEGEGGSAGVGVRESYAAARSERGVRSEQQEHEGEAGGSSGRDDQRRRRGTKRTRAQRLEFGSSTGRVSKSRSREAEAGILVGFLFYLSGLALRFVRHGCDCCDANHAAQRCISPSITPDPRPSARRI